MLIVMNIACYLSVFSRSYKFCQAPTTPSKRSPRKVGRGRGRGRPPKSISSPKQNRQIKVDDVNPPVASKEPANVRTPVTTVTSEEPVVRHSFFIILCFVYNLPDVDVHSKLKTLPCFSYSYSTSRRCLCVVLFDCMTSSVCCVSGSPNRQVRQQSSLLKSLGLFSVCSSILHIFVSFCRTG